MILDVGRILSTKKNNFEKQYLRLQLEWTADNLHDLRVACRRFRSALKTFSSFLPSEYVVQTEKELKRFMKSFNHLRDIDVQIEFLQNLSINEKSTVGKEVVSFLRDLREIKRQTEMELKLSMSTDKKYQFDELPKIVSPSSDDLSIADLLKPDLSSLVEREKMVPWEQPSKTPEPLHKLRIAIKQFRYALECVHDKVAYGAEKIVQLMKYCQDVLGFIHDRDVFVKILIDRIQNKAKNISREFREVVCTILDGDDLTDKIKACRALWREGDPNQSFALLKIVVSSRQSLFKKARSVFEAMKKLNWHQAIENFLTTNELAKDFAVFLKRRFPDVY